MHSAGNDGVEHEDAEASAGERYGPTHGQVAMALVDEAEEEPKGGDSIRDANPSEEEADDGFELEATVRWPLRVAFGKWSLFLHFGGS